MTEEPHRVGGDGEEVKQMRLTDKQIAEVFDLLELASAKQRKELMASLRLLDFEDRMQSYDVTWTDDCTASVPPNELISVLEPRQGPVPFVHLDELD